jgi:hypothetical protein
MDASKGILIRSWPAKCSIAIDRRVSWLRQDRHCELRAAADMIRRKAENIAIRDEHPQNSTGSNAVQILRRQDTQPSPSMPAWHDGAASNLGHVRRSGVRATPRDSQLGLYAVRAVSVTSSAGDGVARVWWQRLRMSRPM